MKRTLLALALMIGSSSTLADSHPFDITPVAESSNLDFIEKERKTLLQVMKNTPKT